MGSMLVLEAPNSSRISTSTSLQVAVITIPGSDISFSILNLNWFKKFKLIVAVEVSSYLHDDEYVTDLTTVTGLPFIL